MHADDGGEDSHLYQLYHHGGVAALATSLHSSLTELRDLERSRIGVGAGAVGGFPTSLAKTTMTEHSAVSDRTSAAVVVVGRSRGESDAAHHILGRIGAARERLHQSSRYVQIFAAQAMMFEDEGSSSADDENEEEDEEERNSAKGKSRAKRISEFLNLLSTFLYMMGYYIVVPTSASYATRLGASPAISGIIIGMTPVAALISSVLYGWWSNYSYKSALLFASLCSLVGNVLYALALSRCSLPMVILGRFLNGFGSARAINRRFIADTYGRSERTAASAAFVTAGALGMSAGPAVAAVLGGASSEMPDYDDLNVGGGEGGDRMSCGEGMLWTVETAPGWIMMTAWAIFLIVAAIWFTEPRRRKISKKVKSVESSKEYEMTEAEGSDEGKPLLSILNGGEDKPDAVVVEEEKKRHPPLYHNVPVMMTLGIYFVLKLVLECLMSSTATLTMYYFGWDATFSGTYLAFLGLLMFPANLGVAALSSRYDDREMITAALYVMLAGIVGIISYGGLFDRSSSEAESEESSYSVLQYVFYGVVIFLSCNCLEGPNMSLLSKTVPGYWAKGTFNSGFLATEAGTLGRAVGDVFLSVAAYGGFDRLLNQTFIPLGVLVAATIAVTRKNYSTLEPADDEDDE